MSRPPKRCASCATELGPRQLACPGCGALVHAAALKRLAAEAEAAEAEAREAKEAGERRAAAKARKRAVSSWQQALALLPSGSRQRERVALRADALAEGLEGVEPPSTAAKVSTEDALQAAEAAGQPPGEGPAAPPWYRREGIWGKVGGALLAVVLLLWKLKFVFAFVLTKGKVLLLGLTKGSTFISMFLSFGVYWAAFGWPFALGLVLSIYVHEMGHVIALRQHGIVASAPMFIPGLGAYVRLRQRIDDPRVDARIGLGGPVGGLAAALVALGIAHAGGSIMALAIARVGGWINLFNLLPIWQLDGGRAFNALTRAQRGFATAGIALALLFTTDGLLVLLLICAALRTLGQGAEERDRGALWLYLALIAAFSFLASLPVPLKALVR